MRITMSLADQIAKALTAKNKEHVKKLDIEFKELVTDLYLAQVPAKVSALLKIHPEWFDYTNTIIYSGNGNSHTQTNILKKVVKNGNQSWCGTLNLNPESGPLVADSKYKAEKAEEDFKKLFLEIRTALVGLRTFAQVEKTFPEAVPFLPTSTSTALMVNLDQLRAKLIKD